jgi:hypothetical protein
MLELGAWLSFRCAILIMYKGCSDLHILLAIPEAIGPQCKRAVSKHLPIRFGKELYPCH